MRGAWYCCFVGCGDSDQRLPGIWRLLLAMRPFLSGSNNLVTTQLTLSALDGREVEGQRAYEQVIGMINDNQQIFETSLRGR